MRDLYQVIQRRACYLNARRPPRNEVGEFAFTDALERFVDLDDKREWPTVASRNGPLSGPFFRGRPPVGDNISLTLTGDAAGPEWRVGCLKASYVGRQAVGARTWVGSTAPWMMLRIEM